MDYLFLSSITDVINPQIIISYDIGCQWGRNFTNQINTPALPTRLQPPFSASIQYVVPKFHLESHTPKCHAPHSFNYTIGVGRTDGEGVERNWSLLNGVSLSVSMMGAGGRWDTLDDFCNFANWRKTIDLRAFICPLPFF